MDKKTSEIICTSYKNGKCHDYRLFKESGIKIQSKVKIAVDTGYQGLQKVHLQTILPKKKSKKSPLSTEDKKNNTVLAKERVSIRDWTATFMAGIFRNSGTVPLNSIRNWYL